MSYVALATERFDEVSAFYGEALGFPRVAAWDRENARGLRFDLGGVRLEIFDNARQREPMEIPPVGDRVHVVVEVDDIESAHAGLGIAAPAPQRMSWGAIVFQVRDPDGVPITFLQWVSSTADEARSICGRVVSGRGQASGFTQLEWVRREFVGKLGIDPFPGTVNLQVVDAQSQVAWQGLRESHGVTISDPDGASGSCGARCFPVEIERVGPAAIVLPEVDDYPVDQVEVIAGMGIRDALQVSDGDLLTLRLGGAPSVEARGAVA